MWSGLLFGFQISGAPVITGNKANGIDNNVYLLGSSYTIRVVGELTVGAKIGVSNTGAVATGFTAANGMSGKLPSEYFIPDNKTNNCVYVSDGENGTVSVGTHDYDNAPWGANYETHWQECQNGCGIVYYYYHNFNQEVVSDVHLKSAATCTAKDLYYKSCECGAQGEETFECGEALGHGIIMHEAQQPTCTGKGWEAYEGCSRCDYATEKVEITALGHDKVQHGAKPATCTEKGWNAYETCSRCDYTTYAEMTALGHNYGEWTVTKEATVEENGEEQRVCSHDSTHIETRQTDKLVAPENKGGLSAGAIAGIVIACILVALLAAYVACYFALYRRGILLKGKVFDAIYMPMNAIFGKKEQE